MSSTVYSLSIHADYKCRHSGACCTADWDVPVELPVYRSLDQQLRAGALRVAPTAEPFGSLAPAQGKPLEPFIVEPGLPDGAAAMLERTDRGECVFFERSSHLCVVHRDAGESALPATCRHFPRLAVADSRGTFVTLSHFCPTAASMLFREDVALEIVPGPAAFPPADYDGLTVTADDLPPLLSPTMLMDPSGYGAWERHMVGRCAADQSPESVVATLASDAAMLKTWRPGAETLEAFVGNLPQAFISLPPPASLAGSLHRYAEVVTAIPDDLKPEPDEHGLDAAYLVFVRARWSAFQRPVNRYLAAKAFASWTAYQGKGVSAIVRGLEAALALVRIEASRQCRDARRELDRELLLEAFRSADFALNHLAVGEDLADAWSRHEDTMLVP